MSIEGLCRKCHSKISSGDGLSAGEVINLLENVAAEWGTFFIIWHSLGFIHVTLWSEGDCSLRLHIWLPGVRPESEQEWKIHDHVYSFSSMVLAGCMTDTIVSVGSAVSRTHQIYEVEYGLEESVLHRTAVSVSIDSEKSRSFCKETVYSLQRKIFHFTSASADQLTATLMATYDIENSHRARVLGDLSGPDRIRRPIVRRTPSTEPVMESLIAAVRLDKPK